MSMNRLNYPYYEIYSAYLFAGAFTLIFTGCGAFVFVLSKCKVERHRWHC